jgi:hypothetical protein
MQPHLPAATNAARLSPEGYKGSPIGKHENPVMFMDLAEKIRKRPQVACTRIRLQKEMAIQKKIRRAPFFS